MFFQNAIDGMYVNPLFSEMFDRAKVQYDVDYYCMCITFKSTNEEAPLTDDEKALITDWYHRNIHGGTVKFK